MSKPEPSLSEQQQIRLEKLEQLRELNINPYPHEYDVTHRASEIFASEEDFISDESESAQEFLLPAV